MTNLFAFAILLLVFFQFLGFYSLRSVELIQSEAQIANNNSDYMKVKSKSHTNMDLAVLKIGANK